VSWRQDKAELLLPAAARQLPGLAELEKHCQTRINNRYAI
jgi:hypothetical protein